MVTINDRAPDPLQIQISARCKIPRGCEISANVLREAIAYRIREGQDPPGIRLRLVRWRHGAKDWKPGSDADWQALAGPLLGWSETRLDDRSLWNRPGRRQGKRRSPGL